jgi:hypothetical protein
MRPKLWSALLCVALCGAIIGTFLVSSGSGSQAPHKTPFVAKAQRGRPFPVPLERRPGKPGASLYRTDLYLASAGTLLEHPEVQLFFSTGPGSARLLHAELQVVGTPCRYQTVGLAKLVEGEPLALRRDAACTAPALIPNPRLVLTAEREGDEELSVWAFRPRADAPNLSAIQVSPSSPEGDAPLLRGFFVDDPPTASRIRLLNYMWQVSSSPLWLWVVLGLAAALAVTGALIFPMHRLAPEGGRALIRPALAGGLGAACLAGALGLGYATLSPPLSGPDEPYHMLGFAKLNREGSLPAELVEWMNLTHFQRIRGHATERFRAADIGNPLTFTLENVRLDDPQFTATEVAERSASAAALWGLTGRRLRHQSPSRTLLALRLLNASLFAVMVGLGTGLAVACSAGQYPQLLCLPFLFVPTLPFFAMHFSESALLTSAYVLLASSLAMMFLDGPQAHGAGFPLGLSTGLMLAGGRSAWPLAALVAVALVARVLLGPAREEGHLRAAVVFWAGLALGGSVFYLLLNDDYGAMLMDFAAFAPPGLGRAHEWLILNPPGIFGLAALAGTAEVSLGRLRRRVAGAWGPGAGTAVRCAGFVLAGVVALSLIGSLFLSYPRLEAGAERWLAPRDFVTRVLATAATMFRLRDPSFLLFSTFWAGFGWLDTMPDSVFQAVCALLTAICLIGLLLHLARQRDVRRSLWLLALGLGSTVALAIYAWSMYNYAHSVYPIPMNLHGRYLIGLYLVVLSLIGSGAAWALARVATTAPVPRTNVGRIPGPAALFVLSSLLHTYCLCFILSRYF